MKVQVITDSTVDIPQNLADELGIRVVPIYLRFGDKTYRDGIDIRSDEFHSMLASSPVHPATSQARLAQSGASLSEVIGEKNRAVNQVGMFGLFETMKYLARGGRINKTIATVARVLNVMPHCYFRCCSLGGIVQMTSNIQHEKRRD